MENKEVQREKDIDLAIDMMIQGVPKPGIRKVLREKRGYDDTGAGTVLNHAIQIIKQSATLDREEELGKAIRRLENLYLKFSRANDNKNCLATQKELSDLAGLRNLTVKNINIDGGKLSEAEQKRILGELNLLKEI